MTRHPDPQVTWLSSTLQIRVVSALGSTAASERPTPFEWHGVSKSCGKPVVAAAVVSVAKPPLETDM